MDFGLLMIRAVVGLLLVGHGTQKLFGWFGGGGPQGTGRQLASLGFRPGDRWARLGGLAEAGGGALLTLGLLTPLGSVAIIAMMFNAIVTVHLRKGLWVQEGGFEYPLVLAVVVAGLAFVGPGAWSVDGAIGWIGFGDLLGLATVIAGCILGLIGLGSRTPQPAERSEERRAA